MATKSRLDISRYGSPETAILRTTNELYSKSNTTLNPKETLPKLLRDFRKLYIQTQEPANFLYDVILEIDTSYGKFNKIYAQKQILIARSAYFEKKVFGDENVNNNSNNPTDNTTNPNNDPNNQNPPQQGNQTIIPKEAKDEDEITFETSKDEISGVETIKFKGALINDIDLLRECVEYIYWGFWEPKRQLVERTKSVFKLAATFDLKELRNMAGEELKKNLNPNNVADFLVCAHNFDGKVLKKDCIEYIIQNRKEITKEMLEHVLLDKIKDKRGKEVIAEIYRDDVMLKFGRNKC